MDAHKMKYIKQNELKVYNCTFELYLFQLRIFLRFPCKFFVEWKTTNSRQHTKTEGFVQNNNGKVDFNQKLTLEIQMLHDTSRNTWIRKDTTISVYLVTRNKPDFNQLVGRINIDLSTVCEENPYSKPFTESLTYSSASADLRFSLNLKYSLMSKKSVSELDLIEFNERLYLVKQQDNLNKSKSVEQIKNLQPKPSPVYQIAKSPINVQQKPEVNPFHFPITKLESYGHQVHEILGHDHEEIQEEFYMRMTLGPDKTQFSKQEYDYMIKLQTKGMKKSDLMVVPDMKKSNHQEDYSELNTGHSKKTDKDSQQFSNTAKSSPLKNLQSSNRLNKRSKSPESDIDIVINLSGATYSKDIFQIHEKNLENSINSSNSFSISKLKAQFEGLTGEGFTKSRSPKESINSFQMPTLLKKHVSSNEGKEDLDKMTQKYEANKNRVKQLKTDVSELVKILTNSRQKIQKLEDQKKEQTKIIHNLIFENAELQKKVDELEQRANYESRINQLNCEKLKIVSSQLTQQKRKASRSHDLLADIDSFHDVRILKEKLNKLCFEKDVLEEKLFRRDQIELQNQIRIQELSEELTRYRTQKLDSAPKIGPYALQIESKIVQNESFRKDDLKKNEYISFLEEKIESLEIQNINIKDMCNEAYKKIDFYLQRDQKMKQNVFLVESEFEAIVKTLIERQNVLKEKILQTEFFNKKSPASNFNQSTIQQLKIKQLEEDLTKKDHMLQFFQNQIQLLSEELAKLQIENKELLEIQKNVFRESLKFEGDLKVIREEESYRESLASSGQIFRLSFSSSRLNVKEENAVASYKAAIQSYNSKYNIDEKFDIEFTGQTYDLKKKAFDEFQRSAKVINNLLNKNLELKTKIEELQEQEKISAGSSNFTLYRAAEQQIVEQLSQATKKKYNLSIGNESKLSREVEKLKSILYDKNKQMNDLIASYEKLKFQKESQAIVMKSRKVKEEKPQIQNDDESDTELVHDLLDLQIRLSKEKQHKSQIMSQLQLQKSLNKSQQFSHCVQFEASQIYKQLRCMIMSRQNFITNEKTLHQLVKKINELQRASEQVDKDMKLMYLVEEKSRCVSKELQVIKSALFKMNFKEIQPYQFKTLFANILKPCQTALNELLAAVEEMVNKFA